MLFWLPPTAAGLIRMVNRAEIDAIGVQFVAAGVVLGWLATNWFGAMPNRRMRRQLEHILAAKKVDTGTDPWFVGFASPRFSSMLDPHEDVGLLVFTPAAITFHSETRNLELAKIHAKRVGFRPNVHTWVLLGRWVSIDGEVDGRPVRLLLEPREKSTLVGNLLATRKLADRLREWLSN